jgi:hydrogenase maturation factor HypF (carbamoyltransferase family)
MMMINEGAWIIGTVPTSSQHPGHDINVFAHEESARTKSLIKSIDRLKGRSAASPIGPMNQASREKISRTKVFSVGSFLNCNRVILRIVQQNSPAYEAEPGVFFEAAYNRIKEIAGWITVVVRKSNYLSL